MIRGRTTYLVLVHLLLIVAIGRSDLVPLVRGWLGLAPPTPELTEHYHRLRQVHARLDPQVPRGAILFFGDSLTQALDVTALTPRGVNFGIGTDTTFGLRERLPAYGSLARAAGVVLAIGVNDLPRRDNQAIQANLAAILAAIPDPVPVLVSGILPVDESRGDMAGWNERIVELNRWLARQCAVSPRLTWVDAGPRLADGSGQLRALYQEGDGLHLGPEGYRIWSEVLAAGLHTAVTVTGVGD